MHPDAARLTATTRGAGPCDALKLQAPSHSPNHFLSERFGWRLELQALRCRASLGLQVTSVVSSLHTERGIAVVIILSASICE